jgi:hypothetical protein
MSVTFVVYESVGRMFVTTPELEQAFLTRASSWGYDLVNDFDRREVASGDTCVMIEASLKGR